MAGREAGQGPPERDGRISILTFCAGHLAVDWPHGAFWILAPAVALAMELGPAQLGLMVTLIATGSMLSFIPAGMACDRIARRGPLFVATFAWVAVGYGAASLAPDPWTLTAMLALAGMGTSAWHPLATGTLAQAMPRRKAQVLGLHAMGGTLAEVFAPVLTGLLLAWVDWRQALALSVLPALLAGAVFFRQRRRLTFAVETGDAMPGIGALLRHWSRPAGLALVAMIGSYNMAIIAVLAMATLYIVGDLGFSAFHAGIAFAAMVLAGALLQPAMGHLSDSLGRRPVFATAMLVAVPLGFAMPFVAAPWLALAFLVAMIGMFYGVRSVVLATAVDFVGKREGTTLGAAFVMMDGIGALGAVAGGWAGEAGLAWAFALASAFAALSAAIALVPARAFPAAGAEGMT